jgi:hypothetical protein
MAAKAKNRKMLSDFQTAVGISNKLHKSDNYNLWLCISPTPSASLHKMATGV